MSDTTKGGPRTGEIGGARGARLKAALQSNIAKRKARAHAARQPQNAPHEPDAHEPEGDGAASPREGG